MKIKILSQVQLNGKTHQAGAVVDAERDDAGPLFEVGAAEPANAKEAAAAKAAAAETKSVELAADPVAAEKAAAAALAAGGDAGGEQPKE